MFSCAVINGFAHLLSVEVSVSSLSPQGTRLCVLLFPWTLGDSSLSARTAQQSLCFLTEAPCSGPEVMWLWRSTGASRAYKWWLLPLKGLGCCGPGLVSCLQCSPSVLSLRALPQCCQCCPSEVSLSALPRFSALELSVLSVLSLSVFL